MKFKKLLVLSMLSLMGTSAWAAVPEGVWTMPEPQGLEFTTFTDDGTRFYLYNPGAKLFFASGNSWNTQASVRVYGYPVWLEVATEEGAPEGSYELWNDVDNPQRTDVAGNHNVFFDGGSFFVDHAAQAGYTWNYTIEGDFVRLGVVTKPGMFMGWDGTYIDSDDEGATCSSVLKNLDPATEGVCVDWKAVTEESYEAFVYGDDYQAYCDGVKLYIASLGLKKALEDAEAAGLTCTATLAVYSDNTSSIEDLRAGKNLVNARIALKNAIEAAKAVYVDVAAAETVLADESKAVADVNKAETDLKDITAAKKKLNDLIEDCKSKGYTETAAAETVLKNTTAAKEDVEKAESDLSAAYTEWGKGHASVENPADMSGMIVNPNFDNASYTGWEGTAPNMTGSGPHGPANVAEKWNDTFDTYQNIEGLPGGIYALGAQTMWRGSWNDMQNKVGPASYLYATVGELESSVPFNFAYAPLNTESLAGDTSWGVGAGETSYTDEDAGITYYIPNDPSCFRVYAEKGWYDTKVLFSVNEGDAVRIGVKNPAKKGDADNWSVFDTFTLTYYGNAADAIQMYLPEALKDFAAAEVEEGTLFTESYLTAYNDALKGEHKASTMDELNSVMDAIAGGKQALDKNIELWQELQAAVAKGRDYAVKPDYQELLSIDVLADYVDESIGEYVKIEAAHALTNEELEAEIEKVNNMMTTVINESKADVKDGKDMTDYIVNPGFDDDKDIDSGKAEGWTIDNRGGGNVVRGPLGQGNKDLMEGALGYMNYCFEAWHSKDFDVWQEIEDLPVGMYELQVQGYVRYEAGGDGNTAISIWDGMDNEWSEDNDAIPTSPISLYMNNAESKFPNIFSEPKPEDKEYTEVESWYKNTDKSGNDWPNSMGGAAQCFGWGLYKSTAYGLISKAGDKFRIGVKGQAEEGWWCIFDSFKLTYRTPTVEIVQPVLEEALKTIDVSQPMGKDKLEKAKEVNEEAAKAIADADGTAQFRALSKVYDVTSEITTSVALFKKLLTESEDLNYAITESKADSQTKADANDLMVKMQDAANNSSVTDEEAQAMIDAIPDMLVKLALPADMANASDENPVECTGVIKSASFETPDFESTSEGWTNPGNLGNDETQRGALAMEFWQVAFDMYQTISGLPAGTYKLTVDAWCRLGGNEETYKAWNEDPNATMAYVYAVDGDSTVYAAPVANLMKAGDGLSGNTEFVANEEEDLIYYMPDDLVSGRDNIENNEGLFTSEVICKVGEDGVLTVGIKKAEEKTNSWVVLDNFRLFYLGANSSQTPSGDASGINNAEIAAKKIEFFSISGARVSKPGKGVAIMKTTGANGDVKYQKVMIK